MQPNLPVEIVSLQDLRELIDELRMFAHWFSQAAIKLQVTNKQPSQPPSLSGTAAVIINQLQQSGSYNEEAIEQLIQRLENFVEEAALMTVTLAGPVPNALKKQITEWSRENISPNILIDFRFDRTLLGGMVVHYGSHTHDWSLRSQLLAYSPHFTEVLKHV